MSVGELPSSPVSARDELQAHYNDLLALQDQTDQVPLAKALDAVGLALSLLGHAQTGQEAREKEITRLATIVECALVAEGFDAACNSPRMKLFEEAGLVIAIYKRDGEIGAAIRALADTSTDRACDHDWKVWPETDGQSQRCMKCGAYRDTPVSSPDRTDTRPLHNTQEK